MYSFFLNYKDPLERARTARRMEIVKEQGRGNCDFRALPGCGCWIQDHLGDEINLDGTNHSNGCQAIEVAAPPPRVDIQWTWFPSFIAQDVRMHGQLEAAMQETWAGKLTAESLEGDQGMELHSWICDWVASQFPFYTGIRQWLLDMAHVQPRG